MTNQDPNTKTTKRKLTFSEPKEVKKTKTTDDQTDATDDPMKNSSCYGCQVDSPSQKDHMEPYTGCLADIEEKTLDLTRDDEN